MQFLYNIILNNIKILNNSLTKGNEAMYIYVILRSEVKNSGSYSDFKYLFFLLYV